MKKYILLLIIFLSAPLAVKARAVYMDDFMFQKQIVGKKHYYNGDGFLTHTDSYTCQAFFIHKNWLVTSAHCVDSCLDKDNACQIKVLLAQGEINASASITRKQHVFIPKQYRTADKQGRLSTHKAWDIALLYYQPQEFLYEFAEGGNATREEFEQALAKDLSLLAQWKFAKDPHFTELLRTLFAKDPGLRRPWDKLERKLKFPVLHTYNGPELMTLQQNLFVPRWNWGELEMFSDPKTVLYFGEGASLWAADGFGVDHGNSGGAVVLSDGGVVGVATAKMNNNLPADVRRAFPTFGQADDFFLFTGFAPKTTLRFIEQTMMKFGDRPRTQKLHKIMPTIEPGM